MPTRETVPVNRLVLRGTLLLGVALLAPWACSTPRAPESPPNESPPTETPPIETPPIEDDGGAPELSSNGESELASGALPALLYPGQTPPGEPEKIPPARRRWVRSVTPIFPGDSRKPQLPWVFEMSAISGWVPGPSGIVIDRAGVVWQFDHRQRPWQPKDFAGTEVTEEELAEKFSKRTAKHAVDSRLFSLVRRLAERLSEVPLRSHQVRTLDYAPTYQFLASGGDGKYREVVIASTDQSRTGEEVDLLLEWGGMQFGDPALARFPKERIPPGALADLAKRIEAVLSREE